MICTQPDEIMIKLPDGQLAIVIAIHDNGDCTYLTGNGQEVRLAHYSQMVVVESNEINETFI